MYRYYDYTTDETLATFDTLEEVVIYFNSSIDLYANCLLIQYLDKNNNWISF